MRRGRADFPLFTWISTIFGLATFCDGLFSILIRAATTVLVLTARLDE